MSASEDEYDPTAEERAEVEAPPPPPPPRGIPVLDDDMYDPLDAGERASSEEDDAGYCFDDDEAEAPEEPEEEPEDPEAAAAKAKAVSIMKQRDKTLLGLVFAQPTCRTFPHPWPEPIGLGL